MTREHLRQQARGRGAEDPEHGRLVSGVLAAPAAASCGRRLHWFRQRNPRTGTLLFLYRRSLGRGDDGISCAHH